MYKEPKIIPFVLFTCHAIMTVLLAACEFGYYGIGCRQKCSAFCETSFDCNTVTGQCNGGCMDGWEGPKCLKRMSIITYICCIIKTIILVKRTEYNLKKYIVFLLYVYYS